MRKVVGTILVNPKRRLLGTTHRLRLHATAHRLRRPTTTGLRLPHLAIAPRNSRLLGTALQPLRAETAVAVADVPVAAAVATRLAVMRLVVAAVITANKPLNKFFPQRLILLAD